MSKAKLFVLGIALFGCANKDSSPTADAGAIAPPFTNGVSTLAGAANAGYVDGDRDIARFANPVNVAYGPDGNVYVADFDNNKLRMVASDGTTTTIISQPTFARPFGLAFAGDGSLFVSTDNDQTGLGHDDMSGTIWKVDVHAKTATVIANAIGRPRSLFVLKDGRLAASDDLHHVVEVVDTATGAVTILAGAWGVAGFADALGVAAQFSTPYGIVQRADGMLVVADFDNQRLRLVGLNGATSTLAGTGTAGFADGAMAAAQFSHPQGLSMTTSGDIFLTDLGNFRVRRVSGTTIDTVAGDGTGGYIDNDDRLASELYGLEGLSVKPDGSMVFVADGTRGDAVPYNRVRQILMAN